MNSSNNNNANSIGGEKNILFCISRTAVITIPSPDFIAMTIANAMELFMRCA